MKKLSSGIIPLVERAPAKETEFDECPKCSEHPKYNYPSTHTEAIDFQRILGAFRGGAILARINYIRADAEEQKMLTK